MADSLALRETGITGNTSDPPDGVIDRDQVGRPTRVLREVLINLVRTAIPGPTEDETVEAVGGAFPLLHRLGLTGIHDDRSMGK